MKTIFGQIRFFGQNSILWQKFDFFPKNRFFFRATDGLWDNVPESVLVETLSVIDQSNIQAVCNSIALIARQLSHDQTHASPFALKAGEHGIQGLSGGKPDDITLVLLYIS
jgi:serine/threonine protein phosphatase PrpC